METYLVIENYKSGKTKLIYERFKEKGRMLPVGVEYENSWVEENLQICYQIMKSENIEKINEWISNWKDLVDFEVKRVLTTDQVNTRLNNKKSE